MNMLVTILGLCCLVCVGAKDITIVAKWRDDKFQVLNHFWKNTGFSPLGDAGTRKNFLLSCDEKMNLALIGSVPNQGITHVRIHWILDLVKIRGVGVRGPIFDFQDLDEIIAWLHQHELIPHFELMGNPSGYFHDFHVQGDDWQCLIKEILSRYMDLYGDLYVYNWRFELLNEPDLKMYNSFNFTLPQYLEYFHATERALGRILGPAGLFRINREAHPLCWGLLDYCNLNPCKLKTITFHRKGEGVPSKVVRLGVNLITTIRSSFPNLTRVSFGNSEADIMTGWNKSLEWRSDVRYASSVLLVVIGHIHEMRVKRNIPFEFLSNDNGFLSYHPYYFTQRTLLARFQMNNTDPPHVQFFRKPIYGVMGLLSLLGRYVIDIQYNPGEQRFSYVLTAEKHRTTFLGTFTNDKMTDEVYDLNGTTSKINIKINAETSENDRVYVVYTLDNANSSPYQIWKNNGSPNFPDLLLRRKMRLAENFKRIFHKTLPANQTKVSIALPASLNPTIVAINICDSEYEPPGVVENLHYMKVNENEILLLWNDQSVKSRCLLTYVVQFRMFGSRTFQSINDVDFIYSSYHFDGWMKGARSNVTGEYRVAAVDYFGRYGKFSNVLRVSSW